MPLHPNLPGIGVTPFKVGEAAPPAWTPASLPDLELWLPNSFLATIGDAQPIAQWDDASGNAHHATQATATSRPTARLAADGKYEADFDGVDDRLIVTPLALAQPFTLGLVAKQDVTTGTALYFVDSNTSPQVVFYRTSSAWRLFAGTALIGPASDTARHAFVGIYNGASSKIIVDGAETAGNAGANGYTGVSIGASFTPGFFCNGQIRDIVLCAGVLAGDDLTNLKDYLAGLV